MGIKYQIGPAGWSYEDWKGIVYPEKFPKDFDPLQVISSWFNVIEIDSSYYHIPAESHVRSWCRRVRHLEDFQFTIKLWQGFTHQRNYSQQDLNKFRQVLETLAAPKRLSCVLAQFPWSFKNTPENLEWLKTIQKHFSDHPLGIEIRHQSWLQDNTILDFCRDHSIAFCNIDQPELNECIPPTSHTTSNLSYVRFHGRNNENWFRQDANAFDRYDYLYDLKELGKWISRIENISEEVEKIIIVTNNHGKGQAIANGLELKSELTDDPPLQMPKTLLDTYPRLKKSANIQSDNEPEQLSLF